MIRNKNQRTLIVRRAGLPAWLRYELEKGLGAVKMQFRDRLCPLFKCLISEKYTKYDTCYIMVVQWCSLMKLFYSKIKWYKWSWYHDIIILSWCTMVQSDVQGWDALRITLSSCQRRRTLLSSAQAFQMRTNMRRIWFVFIKRINTESTRIFF